MKQATECLKMKPSLVDCLQKRDGQDDALFARWDQSLSKNIARLFGLVTFTYVSHNAKTWRAILKITDCFCIFSGSADVLSILQYLSSSIWRKMQRGKKLANWISSIMVFRNTRIRGKVIAIKGQY